MSNRFPPNGEHVGRPKCLLESRQIGMREGLARVRRSTGNAATNPVECVIEDLQ